MDNKKIEDIYKLTPLQKGMLYHQLRDNDGSYFIQHVFRCKNQVDVVKLSQCLSLLAQKHEILKTKFVYENLHANDLRPEQHPDIDGMIQAIKDQDLKKIAGKLGNVLETVTVKEYPVIQEIKDKMLEFGAIGSLMSGSGPTVFGLFTNPKAAQEAYEELRYGESAELAKQVYLTNFYNQKEEKNHGKQA